MLRPEQMSKVSVTGTKSVVRDVIEVAHEQNLLHLTDYQGEYEGFDTGSPLDGAEEAADKLVTARSLISILDVDEEEDAGPSRIVTEEALEDEFEEVRQEVNELDDRRDEIEDDLQSVEERIAELEPFVDLGIDLDLLSGYDSLEVAVGEGDVDTIDDALEDTEDVEAFETRTGGDTVAVFVYPAGEPGDTLDEALVGVEFTRFDVPDAEGSPEDYLRELENERETLESKLQSVENDLDTLRLEHGDFLLAVEEELAIEVEKAEAPLSFATTEHAFFAEGWIPTKDYEQFRAAVADAVGDRIEVEEVERADYDVEEREPVTPGLTQGSTDGEEVVTDGGEGADGSRSTSELRSDGGHAEEKDIDHPPVVQDNPGPVKPFEMLVRTINRPSYYDLDPTIVLFLTFPLFYGFMIGDIGYGLLYTGIGYWIYSSFESDAIASLGGVGVISGVVTIVFGVLYGEFFGFHLPYTPILHKGLQPAEVEWAQLWLVLSIAAALAHLTTGYAFDFVKQLSHGVKDAVLESGSWVVLMFGVWLWVFSRHAAGGKPQLLFRVLDGHPIALGFNGFPVVVGYVGLALLVVGFVLLVAGEGFIGAVESLNVLTHVLSYTRLAAVMLAKGGMAFVVNLLFFGAYTTAHGEFHFMMGTTAEQVLHHHPDATIMFGGLVHGGIAAILGGLLILVIGHALVLALGITSAGLQAIRLEYVEFFGKFYEGGGKNYEPFGHDRSYTTQD